MLTNQKTGPIAARLGQERAKLTGPTGFRFPDQQGGNEQADDEEDDLYS